METLGAMLRRARIAQGRDLADVAEQIKVHARYLEALESDDLESLPGGFFYKSFVRQYASALGLADVRVEHALSQLSPSGPPPVAPVSEEKPILKDIRPIVAPAAVVAGALISNRLLPSIGVLLLVMVACGAFSVWWKRLQTMPISGGGQRQVSRVLPEPAPTPTPAPTATPAAESPTTPEPSPTPAPPTPTSTPVAAAVPAGAGITLVAAATADAWVRVWCDGKPVFTGLFRAGDRKTFEAAQSARLRTGNAAAMTIEWNGKPLDFPGPPSFVRDVSFTHDAWQPTPGAPVPAPRTEPPPASEETPPAG